MPSFSPFVCITLSLGAMGLAACSCPYYDVAPPQVMLTFSADTLNGGPGFRQVEVHSAYLVRYKNSDFTDLIDTLRQDPTGSKPGQNFAVNYDPQNGVRCIVEGWVTGTAPHYNHYSARSYRLGMPAAARSYALSDIVLKTSQTDERCPQTRIDSYTITINGQVVDVRNSATLTK